MTNWAHNPIKLQPDNFTPPTRTPWGGTRILTHYKKGLDLLPKRASQSVVGESWEVSVEPSFPNIALLSDGQKVPLPDLIARAPKALLGEAAVARGETSTPILIKLLDAADNLSVQVHPSNDYEALLPDESGKPESWYILDALPGSGLYLGLADGVSKKALTEALENDEDLTSMLNFVPVECGDMFIIDPGTIHAIGSGVTLIEAQLVYPGKKGKTYRFWDWNRRYDRWGQPASWGKPRELHVQDSLAVTQFEGLRGAEFIHSVRRSPQKIDAQGNAQYDQLATLNGLQIQRFQGTGNLTLPAKDTLRALVVASGWLSVGGVSARMGESLLLPAAMPNVEVILEDAEALLVFVDVNGLTSESPKPPSPTPPSEEEEVAAAAENLKKNIDIS